MKKLIYIAIVLSIIYTSTIGFVPVTYAVKEDTRLIKTADAPEVFLVKNGRRIHIPNEEVFIAGGYKWREIEIVSDKEMNNIPNTALIKSPLSNKVYAKLSDLPIDKNGVRIARIKKTTGFSEPKTFFPDEWSEEDIINAIVEASNHKIEGTNGFIYNITKKGKTISVKGYFKEGTDLIDTAFPEFIK